jgi:DedD protein
MNDILKQRLVGALILLALGVVFWPIIFVEPGERRGGEELQIPPRPSVDTTPMAPPDTAGLRETSRPPEPVLDEHDRALLTLGPEASDQGDPDPASAEPAAVAEAAAPAPAPVAEPDKVARPTRSEPPERPALDEDGIPISWMLRVASVSSKERADQLRKELLSMGHKAYVQRVSSGGKTLYRVSVGPKVEKARLEQIQAEIDARFGVKTLITRYYP